MHAAHIAHSARLQRVLAVLHDGAEHTTLDIAVGARVCAVNSIIAELRENGYDIRCARRGDRWYYQLDPTQHMVLEA